MSNSKYPWGEGKSLPHQKKKNITTERKVKRTTTDTHGSYPYNVESKTTVVKKADKSGYIKSKKEKFTEGDIGEKPSYTKKTKTSYARGEDKMLGSFDKNKIHVGRKAKEGSVSKEKTKSDRYGKSKKYTTHTIDKDTGRPFNKEITKKEYKQRKRKL